MAETNVNGDTLGGGRPVGETRLLPLDAVRTNPWNPNVMEPHVMASLKHGLATDGWLVSQALLVWATDEKGARQMVIIDGEQRYTAARALGMATGPMVLLDGLTEAKAKALTLSMNNRRGKFDEEGLGKLLREIQFEFPEAALEFGVSDDALAKLLAAPPVDLGAFATAADGAPDPDAAAPKRAGSNADVAPVNTAMVQLFMSEEHKAAFLVACKALGAAWNLATVTEIVVEAVKRAHASHPAQV